MLLRTKIITLFVLITGLSVGSMTMYSAYKQRTTFIATELESQKQVLSLLHNAVSVQFYSFTYEQLQSSLILRRELRGRALALHDRINSLKRSIKELYGVDLYHLPKEDDRSKWTPQERQAELSLRDYLRYEQQILVKQDTDLVVTRNNELFIAPRNLGILTGLSVSLNHLLPIMHSNTNEYTSGYFLTLFNSEVKSNVSGNKLKTAGTAWEQASSGEAHADPEVLAYFGFVEANLPENRHVGMVKEPDADELQLATQEDELRHERNFISYIYKNDAASPYSYAVVAGVDHILEQYQDTAGQVLLRLLPNLQRLSSLLASEMLIVDAQGKVQASSAEHALLAQMPAELLAFCQQEAQAQLEFKRLHGAQFERSSDELDTPIVTIKGKDYVVGCIYFKPLDWYIVNLLPYDVILAPAYQHALTLAGIGFTILLMSILCALWFARRIVAPLRRIAAKAHVIAGTDLSDANAVKEITSSLNFSGKDEISALGLAFVRMGNSLSKNLAATMRITAQKSRMLSELNMARTIQMGMLPDEAAQPKSVVLTHYAMSKPAKEVGGDFFDIFRRDEHHVVYTIGDVSDKGVPAALFMSTTMTLARTCLYQNMSASETMTVVNERLSERNPNLMFVTMLIAIVDERDGSVDWCNAGHCPPLWLKRQGELIELNQIDGPAVGPMEGMSYQGQHFKLEAGDMIFCYTDGVSEAQNVKSEFYGTTRIHELVKQYQNLPARELLLAVEADVAAFSGIAAQSDDITMLALSYRRN